jgi:hypothetical protein
METQPTPSRILTLYLLEMSKVEMIYVVHIVLRPSPTFGPALPEYQKSQLLESVTRKDGSSAGL